MERKQPPTSPRAQLHVMWICSLLHSCNGLRWASPNYWTQFVQHFCLVERLLSPPYQWWRRTMRWRAARRSCSAPRAPRPSNPCHPRRVPAALSTLNYPTFSPEHGHRKLLLTSCSNSTKHVKLESPVELRRTVCFALWSQQEKSVASVTWFSFIWFLMH